ncbi:MAG: hypothetical protein ACRD2Z_00900 [Thermoanaerobaculia bacterium]
MPRRPSSILPLWMLLLVLPAGGCAHLCARWCEQAPVELPPPPPPPEETRPEREPPPPEPEPEIVWEPVETSSPLAAADGLFASGELAAARAAYVAYLNDNPQGSESARALLQLAVIYLQPDGPAYDPALASRVLDRLLAEHDGEPEERAGRALRSLQRQAGELQRQLDELKRIDLEPDSTEEPQRR